MLSVLRSLPSLLRTKSEAQPCNSNDESSSSDSESSEYDDCESDEEPKQAVPEDKENSPDEGPKQVVTENQEKSLNPGLNEQAAPTSVYPPPSSIRTEAILPSESKSGYFVNVDPEDSFVQTKIPLESAPLRTISNSSKGSAKFKNDLQTWYQRSQSREGTKVMKLPSYSNVKEGPAHAPIFKAAVEIYGRRFESDGFHSSKVEAEQNAASVALSLLCPSECPQDQPDVKGRRTVESSQFITDPSNDHSYIDASVPVKTVKLKRQISKCAGLTIDAPIELSEDEESVGSGPPLSTASSPIGSVRSQNARISYEQCWGGFNRQGTRSSGVSTSSLQTKISSGSGATPTWLGNDFRDMAGQFSELQLSESTPVSGFAKRAWEPQSVNWPEQTEHLAALGKLNFSTHGFPILTKLHGLPLEKVFSVDEIMSLQNKTADEVYPCLWDLDVRHNRPTKSQRPPRVQTDPELLLYHCYVNPNAEMRFEVSENRQGSTLLHRTLGFDKVLQVVCEGRFPDKRFKAILNKGIFVGPRLYQYFVHKSSDDISDEEKRNTEGTVKCYFVCTDSQGERDFKNGFRKFNTVAEVRSLFMHADRDVENIPSVSKFIARNQLCLTKTITITDISFSDLVIQELEDLPSKDPKNPGALFTDGTGFISTDLARTMPTNIFQGMKSEDGQETELNEDYPSLLQVRFFHNGAAHKGTLLANKKLPPKTIAYYRSMKKVQSDPRMDGISISSFELVSTSRRPRCAKLSRDLIVLLSIGGVKESVFLDALNYATQQVLMILHDRKLAHKEILQWEWKCDLVEITLLMIAAGIPLEEPALRDNLLTLTKNKLTEFAKGKFPLNGTFYLMGTADPTGTLKPDEVVVLRSDILVTGDILVYRAPGKDPGDPHKVHAVQSQAIEDVVGGAKNIIVFSTQGSRPMVHEIAKGDFDGDIFWICTNHKVVEQFSNWPSRWNPGDVKSIPGKGQQSPKDLSPAQLEDALLDEYLNDRFNKSSVVAIASFRWLKHIDAYLNPEIQDKEIHMKELLKYPDYIYEGVDAKAGVQLVLPPEHESIKRYKAQYLSKKPPQEELGGRSVLGQIYDVWLLTSKGMNDPLRSREDYEVDPAFHVQGSEKYMEYWEKRYNQYRWKMRESMDKAFTEAFDPDEGNRIYASYRTLLYGADSFKERKKDRQQILEEASAIYQIVYFKAGNDATVSEKPRVAFAWRVAGAALATIYVEKQPGESIVWSQATYYEVHKRSKAPRRTLS